MVSSENEDGADWGFLYSRFGAAQVCVCLCVCVCVCVCARVCLCECVCVHPTLEHAVRSLANHWPIEYFLSCAVQDHLEVNASLRCGCMEGFVERRAWSVHRQEIVGVA